MDRERVGQSHLSIKEAADLSAVLHYTLSSAHLLLSALGARLHQDLHIAKNQIMMEDRQQGLEADRHRQSVSDKTVIKPANK